jgi:hypothetical protein
MVGFGFRFAPDLPREHFHFSKRNTLKKNLVVAFLIEQKLRRNWITVKILRLKKSWRWGKCGSETIILFWNSTLH